MLTQQTLEKLYTMKLNGTARFPPTARRHRHRQPQL